MSPCHGEDCGFNPHVLRHSLKYPSNPLVAFIDWKVGEWLKPTDCKSVLARVRGFESLSSNKQREMHEMVEVAGLGNQCGHTVGVCQGFESPFPD
jgi:hypothetical protein